MTRPAKVDFTAVATLIDLHSTFRTPVFPPLGLRTHLTSSLLNCGIIRRTSLTTIAMRLG